MIRTRRSRSSAAVRGWYRARSRGVISMTGDTSGARGAARLRFTVAQSSRTTKRILTSLVFSDIHSPVTRGIERSVRTLRLPSNTSGVRCVRGEAFLSCRVTGSVGTPARSSARSALDGSRDQERRESPARRRRANARAPTTPAAAARSAAALPADGVGARGRARRRTTGSPALRACRWTRGRFGGSCGRTIAHLGATPLYCTDRSPRPRRPGGIRTRRSPRRRSNGR